MTYKDFINTLSRRMGYETEYAESLTAAFVTAISQTLQAGKNVCLRGLGNLYVFKQLELIAENPLTGQKTLQPPRLEVKFEPANTETPNDADTVGATACPRPETDTPQTTDPPQPAEPTSDEGLPWGIIAPIFLAGLLIGGFLVWAIMTYWNQ